MTSMLRPSAILFDWDNTLVDSWQTIHDALYHTFVTMNYPPWSFAETKKRARHSLRDSFPLLFGDAWEQAKSIYLETFLSIHLDRLQAIEGAETALDKLKDQSIYLGVVSNKTGRILRREVEALGWGHHFGKLVGAGDAAADKPARAPVDLALAESGIEAGNKVWFIGDTAIDMETALNAHCIPVLMTLGDEIYDNGSNVPVPVHQFESWAAFSKAMPKIGKHDV